MKGDVEVKGKVEEGEREVGEVGDIAGDEGGDSRPEVKKAE